MQILLQVQTVSSIPPALHYTGLLDAFRRIMRDGGVRVSREIYCPPLPPSGVLLILPPGTFLLPLQALYRGNAANVLRLVPEVGFKFAVNDQFKIMFAPADGSPLGVAEKLAAGASTGEWPPP